MTRKKGLFQVQDQPGSPWQWGVRSNGVGVRLEGQAGVRSRGPSGGRTDFAPGEWGGRREAERTGGRQPGLEPRPPGAGSPCGRFRVWAGGTRLDALCRSFYVGPAEILLTSHPHVSGLIVSE